MKKQVQDNIDTEVLRTTINTFYNLYSKKDMNSEVTVNFTDFVRSQVHGNIVHKLDVKQYFPDVKQDFSYFVRVLKCIEEPNIKSTKFLEECIKIFYVDLFMLMGNYKLCTKNGVSVFVNFDEKLFNGFYKIKIGAEDLAAAQESSKKIGALINPENRYSDLIMKLKIKFDGSVESALMMIYFLESKAVSPRLLGVSK
jgi:hypothetical protein